MSNLGAYQWMTTTAKKIGGPVNLLLLTGTVGAILYKGGEITVRKCIKVIRLHKSTNVEIEAKNNIYKINVASKSNGGLMFEVGEWFRFLGMDGDSVLIEKIGDRNNPYFVSAGLLREISDYSE